MTTKANTKGGRPGGQRTNGTRPRDQRENPRTTAERRETGGSSREAPGKRKKGTDRAWADPRARASTDHPPTRPNGGTTKPRAPPPDCRYMTASTAMTGRGAGCHDVVILSGTRSRSAPKPGDVRPRAGGNTGRGQTSLTWRTVEGNWERPTGNRRNRGTGTGLRRRSHHRRRRRWTCDGRQRPTRDRPRRQGWPPTRPRLPGRQPRRRCGKAFAPAPVPDGVIGRENGTGPHGRPVAADPQLRRASTRAT